MHSLYEESTKFHSFTLIVEIKKINQQVKNQQQPKQLSEREQEIRATLKGQKQEKLKELQRDYIDAYIQENQNGKHTKEDLILQARDKLATLHREEAKNKQQDTVKDKKPEQSMKKTQQKQTQSKKSEIEEQLSSWLKRINQKLTPEQINQGRQISEILSKLITESGKLSKKEQKTLKAKYHKLFLDFMRSIFSLVSGPEQKLMTKDDWTAFNTEVKKEADSLLNQLKKQYQ